MPTLAFYYGSTRKGTAMLKALMFDLDGTLVDTSRVNAEAYRCALAEAGYNLPHREIAEAIAGRHWSFFLPLLIREDDNAGRIATRKKEIYTDMLNDVPVNGLLADLIMAMSAKFAIAVVTTASRSTVEQLLHLHNLADHVDCIVAGEDVADHKPHPLAYELAARILNVTSEECLIFEDSETGLASALAFGAQTLRVQGFPGGA